MHGDEVRHELGNLLAVALANIEGMIDGLVAATPARLEASPTRFAERVSFY